MGNFTTKNVTTNIVTTNIEATNFVTAKTDAPDFIRTDQLDSAAEIWYSNILALIKLR